METKLDIIHGDNSHLELEHGFINKKHKWYYLLRKNTEIINNLIKDKDVSELTDFTATVEGYSKYLENTVGINQDADNALKDLKEQLK